MAARVAANHADFDCLDHFPVNRFTLTEASKDDFQATRNAKLRLGLKGRRIPGR